MYFFFSMVKYNILKVLPVSVDVLCVWGLFEWVI